MSLFYPREVVQKQRLLYFKHNDCSLVFAGKVLQGKEKAPFQEVREWKGSVQKKRFMLILCPIVYVREKNQIHKHLSFADESF